MEILRHRDMRTGQGIKLLLRCYRKVAVERLHSCGIQSHYTHEEYEAFEHGDENTSIGNDSARLASEPMPFIDRSAFLFIVAESIDALLEQATIELRGVVEDDITIWSKIVHGLEVVGMQARQ